VKLRLKTSHQACAPKGATGDDGWMETKHCWFLMPLHYKLNSIEIPDLVEKYTVCKSVLLIQTQNALVNA
jgi:hypothetical protein